MAVYTGAAALSSAPRMIMGAIPAILVYVAQML